ncbi:hypothetical protein [Epilithonimonas xixisoli]|uniref:Uncharacterized protein n=1 Tax=Epilithonimonas xixisoli TaxID=1476462 RepID=A0A4R8I5Z7_9FLAO|nr:hypothetical protein [Epilithonimonas xixisoli]TDX83999.1 hypothetical protein B0I22_1587 [Epilithonimonas xixisoli]
MRKNVIIAVLLLLATVLILNTVFGWFTLSEDERLMKDYENPKNDTITLEKHITKDSTIYVKYTPNMGELVQNNVTKKYNTYVYDTLAPALKIATNKINELQQIKASLEGTVKSQKSEIDKEKNRSVFYKDKYFSAVSKTDTAGNSTLDYKYNAQIDIISELKKKHLLSKEVQEVSITSPDKNLKINGVEHFKKNISIPPKRFGIGIQAGYYLIPESGKIVPAVGVGASYNLLNF